MVSSNSVYHVIGLGFGPANLAIAGALLEVECDGSMPKSLFIERHPCFRWHPGMLLPDTRMQISFLKDLATLRSPQSPITFLSYLQAQNRLLPFINRGISAPSRREYCDYLSWAAGYVQDHGVNVQYGEEITSISQTDDGMIKVQSKNVDTSEEHSRITSGNYSNICTQIVIDTRHYPLENLIISGGGSPKYPDALSPIIPHPRVVHSSSYATTIDSILSIVAITSTRLVEDRPVRIGVIGSGQSSAEVILDLHRRLSSLTSSSRRYHLDLIFRRGSLKPSDDSPFSNEIFDPEATDMMFNLPSTEARNDVLQEFRGTNYGVINPRTLNSLYEIMYNQKLDIGISRCSGTSSPNLDKVHITLRPFTTITTAGDHITGSHMVQLVTRNILDKSISEDNYDAVICGTGYDRSSTWTKLLGTSTLGKHFGVTASLGPIELVPANSSSTFSSVISSPVPDDPHPGAYSLGGERNLSGDSESSTPLSSLDLSPPMHSQSLPARKVYITRNYRLLPSRSALDEQGALKSRIYLQGCTESTHGISESLLSILGVRAGKVVEDIFENEN